MAKKDSLLSILGPGLITGASDDDPSGIATYSQVGAQFGYGMLWTMLVSYPFMGAIQEISAHIGRVTGHGIARNVRTYYPRWLLYGMVLLLCAANIINLGADLGAMAAALALVIGGPVLVYTAGFAVLCIVAEVFIPYKKYVFYLKWFTLVLLAYVATVFMVHVDWRQAAHESVWPKIAWNGETLTAVIAVLGTTISPYLFFWQASEEAEEVQDQAEEHPVLRHPEEARRQFHRIRLDTYAGMAISNIVGFFIILTTAATLHAAGIRTIDSAAQAAKALEPLAGHFAFLLFALGIIGTGLLSVPVLAGSAAFAAGEALHWPVSLQRRPKRVKGFYRILCGCVIVGALLNCFHINPIRALYWAAVINGVVSVPVIAVMMLMTSNRKVMGDFTVSPYLRVMGWLTMGLMLAVTIAMVAVP